MRTTGVRGLHHELSGKAYVYARLGLEEQPWGLVMTVTDPFGNRLRFCQEQPEP